MNNVIVGPASQHFIQYKINTLISYFVINQWFTTRKYNQTQNLVSKIYFQ